MTLPSDDQQQRAAWDLLLLDIEHRTEQVRQMKGYAPLDIEYRTEQLRQLKIYEPWRLIFAGLTSGAAILAVGIAFGHWVLG